MSKIIIFFAFPLSLIIFYFTFCLSVNLIILKKSSINSATKHKNLSAKKRKYTFFLIFILMYKSNQRLKNFLKNVFIAGRKFGKNLFVCMEFVMKFLNFFLGKVFSIRKMNSKDFYGLLFKMSTCHTTEGHCNSARDSNNASNIELSDFNL